MAFAFEDPSYSLTGLNRQPDYSNFNPEEYSLEQPIYDPAAGRGYAPSGSQAMRDSLNRIQADTLLDARVAFPDNNASQYSFLPQFSQGGGQSASRYSPTKRIEPTQRSSSSGMTRSSGSSSGGYANFPTVPYPTLKPIETPTLSSPDLPVYTAPERDETRRDALQTKAAAPGLTRLRRGLDKGIQSTRSIDNPTERKFQLTGMLEEYGLNLGDIISKADMTGLKEYETEFATQLDETKTRYGADVTGAMSRAEVGNQNLMNQYQSELADRNAMFGLQSQLFGQQGIQKQAEAFAGTGSGGITSHAQQVADAKIRHAEYAANR